MGSREGNIGREGEVEGRRKRGREGGWKKERE